MILWFSQQLRRLELENDRVLVFFHRGVVFTYIATVERSCFPRKQQTHLYMLSIQIFYIATVKRSCFPRKQQTHLYMLSIQIFYIATVERSCFPRKQQTHLYMLSIQIFYIATVERSCFPRKQQTHLYMLSIQIFYIATVERSCFPRKQQSHLYMLSIQIFFNLSRWQSQQLYKPHISRKNKDVTSLWLKTSNLPRCPWKFPSGWFGVDENLPFWGKSCFFQGQNVRQSGSVRV